MGSSSLPPELSIPPVIDSKYGLYKNSFVHYFGGRAVGLHQKSSMDFWVRASTGCTPFLPYVVVEKALGRCSAALRVHVS